MQTRISLVITMVCWLVMVMVIYLVPILYNIQYKKKKSLETSGEVWENLKTGGYGIVTFLSTRINLYMYIKNHINENIYYNQSISI